MTEDKLGIREAQLNEEEHVGEKALKELYMRLVSKLSLSSPGIS